MSVYDFKVIVDRFGSAATPEKMDAKIKELFA